MPAKLALKNDFDPKVIEDLARVVIAFGRLERVVKEGFSNPTIRLQHPRRHLTRHPPLTSELRPASLGHRSSDRR